MEEKVENSYINNSSTKWYDAGKGIGMALAQNIIDKAIERDNFLFFSLTKIRFGDKSEQIGFGFFGKVWINNEYPDRTAGFSNWEETATDIDTTASTTPTTVRSAEYKIDQILYNKCVKTLRYDHSKKSKDFINFLDELP